jgi:small subunit ribosomal protein S17e
LILGLCYAHKGGRLGRIKTSFVKHIGKELLEKYGDKFTTDFSENKKIVKEFIDIKSKRLRNVLTGYVTSLKKQEKK